MPTAQINPDAAHGDDDQTPSDPVVSVQSPSERRRAGSGGRLRDLLQNADEVVDGKPGGHQCHQECRAAEEGVARDDDHAPQNEEEDAGGEGILPLTPINWETPESVPATLAKLCPSIDTEIHGVNEPRIKRKLHTKSPPRAALTVVGVMSGVRRRRP